MTTLTDTQVITASGGLVELGYSALSATKTITGTVLGSGTEIIAPLTVVCDGTPVLVEFYAPQTVMTDSQQISISLYRDGSQVKSQWFVQNNVNAGTTRYDGIYAQYRDTPSAGSHTYGVYGVKSASSAAQILTEASNTPAFLRVSKIVQATQWPAVTTGTIICTSSTRPSAPFEGQTIYETDTKKTLTYNGSGWYAFNQVIGKSLQTSTTSTGSTEVDVTGLSATVAVAANRTIKITASVHPYYGTASSMMVKFFQDSTALNQFAIHQNSIGTSPASVASFTHYHTTSAASSSTTFKMRLIAYGSSNTVALYGSSGEAGTFIVEDIGPA